MTTHQARRYREIEVSGEPRRLGQQIGEAAAEEIRGMCGIALERADGRAPISTDGALRVARETVPFIERYAPDLLAEVRGMAEGAAVTIEQIMLLQVRNQLGADADAGCTSVALPDDTSSGRGPIVAQNWDNDPRLDPFIIVLTRRPTGQPAFVSIGPAGLIGYIGFNERLMAACLNTLPGPRRRVGVPHYFTLRRILRSEALGEAEAAVRQAHRAIPANIMLSTPQGPADLEVSIDEVRVLRSNTGHAGLSHANEWLHPASSELAERYGELAQSRARKARVDTLLGSPSPGLGELRTALRDHAAHPRSICRHANDDADTGYWQTVFSVIIEPRDRRMHVSRGTPCEHPYETYVLG